jgi:hypothetical protein
MILMQWAESRVFVSIRSLLESRTVALDKRHDIDTAPDVL